MTVDEALAYSSGDTSVLEKAVGKIAYEYKIMARELSEKQEEIKQDYTLDTELLGDIKRFEMLPEKTQPRTVVAKLPPCPTNPPQCEPEVTMAAATSQSAIVFAPPTMEPTRPEQCMPPLTVPTTTRLLIVAPEMAENGAT